MRPFPEPRSIRLPASPTPSYQSRVGSFFSSLIIFYYLPPLLIVSGVLPFRWRFYILAGMTVVMLAFAYWRDMSLKELGFRRDTLKASLILNGSASLLLVTSMFIALNAGLVREPAATNWEMFFAYYLLISSPSQEFLFRSSLFALMSRDAVGGPSFRIILSAVTFSFLHIIYRDPLALLATFAAGLFWGWIYYRHPNFWGVALSHAVVGATAIKVGVM